MKVSENSERRNNIIKKSSQMENYGNDALTKLSSQRWGYNVRKETVKREKEKEDTVLEKMRGNWIQTPLQ